MKAPTIDSMEKLTLRLAAEFRECEIVRPEDIMRRALEYMNVPFDKNTYIEKLDFSNDKPN